MRSLRVYAFLALGLLGGSTVCAAATIQITSPEDQTFVNPSGGAPDLVEVSYHVSGNTCVGFRSSFSVTPYVNGVAVLCSGSGCGCDGTTENCNNVTRTLTLDGNDFDSCVNTIQLALDPAPFTPPLCITPGPDVFSGTIQVWQDPHGECTGPSDCNNSTVGRPVDVASGKMYHDATDLQIQGPLPIVFTRRYDSHSTFNGAMGFGWQHAYQMRIEPAGTNRQVLVDAVGRRIYFARNTQGVWQPNRIDRLTLTAPGNPAWRITDKHQNRYDFDGSGRLTEISDRNGNTIVLDYTGADLTSITDAFARALTLAYDGNSRLQTLSAGGRSLTYTYDNATGNLERADWSDGSFTTYEYDDPNDSHNLTAVRDSFGHLVEGHLYDNSDRVTSTQSDGGNYAYTLSYDSPAQTTVTNSRGVATVYTHDGFSGRVTSSSGPGCASCGGGGILATRTYDRFLNLTQITDALSVVTDMTYDGNGNMLTRVEAVGTSLERTSVYSWNPSYGFLETVTIPSVGNCANTNEVLTNTYDGATGDRLSTQLSGCSGTDTFSRTTVFTYDAHGRIATVDGPRTDVTDVTTLEYYADADPDPDLRGRLMRVTNPVGHQTTYDDYDLFGNVGTVIDPNNVETSFLYDTHDRMIVTRILGAVPADDIVTEQVYDLEGNIDLVRLPDCVETGAACAFSLDYTYDAVNRLTELTDPLGNKIVYTHDTEGNRTREEYRNPSSVVKRFTNFAYDDINRLEYVYYNEIVPEDPGSVFLKLAYFDDGMRQSELDPEGHTTTFAYDELKRLTSVTRTAGMDTLITQYDYDGQDNLSSLIDANGVPTTFEHHDAGWRLQTVSPDSGTTDFDYDLAGNVTSITDANGVTMTRVYDALNRLTSVSYPDAGLNVGYSYDSLAVTYGIGRRTGMTDASGSSVYDYDRRGLLTREEKTIAATTWVTQYGYDKTGNLTQILYPTHDPLLRQGQVDYTYDAAGRTASVTATVNGAPTGVASSLSYEPFGPRRGLTFASGLVDTRSHDTRYQLGAWTLGSLLAYTHLYDNDLNLTARMDNLNGANNRSFGYDEAHRLTSASGPWGPGAECPGPATYTYDSNGNRLCKGEQSPQTLYSYTPNTNRLESTSGGEVSSYIYDAAGNATADGTRTYEYTDANRLGTVDSGAGATYTHDGDGRRVIRTAGGSTAYFLYDAEGWLLARIDAGSTSGREYLYLHDAPIARLDWTTEEDLGDFLRVDKSPPNATLDWSLLPAAGNDYVVRRKQIVDPSDRSFAGSTVIATPSDPTQTHDDPVLGDAASYFYRVFRIGLQETLFTYHTDHLGTPIAMTDSGGNPVWRAEHLPFGGIHELSVGTVPDDLRFSGQLADSGSALNYNYFRDYDPATGRYRTSDPIGQAGGSNTYAYVFGNPLRFIDPPGLAAWEVKNSWGRDQMQDYSDFMGNFISSYNKKIDCADLGFLGLIRFASQNGLPVRLKYWANGGWQYYDASSDDFSSPSQFERTVLQNLGAWNLIDNTRPVPLSDLRSGDFLMSQWSGTPQLGHTRIAESSRCNRDCSDATVTWYQGNLPPVVPEKKTGPFSGINGGKLPASDIPRRWRFPDWNPR